MTINTESLDKSYMIHIRSKDCVQLTDGLNTDLLVELDNPIKKNNSQDIHISLSSAEIPFNFYSFSSNLDNLNLYVDSSSNLVIEEGNYDIYELIKIITDDVTFPYTATYNQNKSKVTLTNSDSTQHIINFSQENSRGLAKALGFERIDRTITAGGNIESEGAVNLTTIHSIFLHSNLTLDNVMTTENKNIESILDKIPILVNPFEIIHYNPYQTSPFSVVLNNTEIKNFRVSLKDQNSNLLDLNDTNYELSLLIEIHNKTLPAEILPPVSGRRMINQPDIIIEPRELERPPQESNIIQPVIRQVPINREPPTIENFTNKPELLITKQLPPEKPDQSDIDKIDGDLLEAVLNANFLID